MESPNSAKALLAKALLAEEIASLATTQIGKAAWLDVANQYRILAEFADKRGY